MAKTPPNPLSGNITPPAAKNTTSLAKNATAPAATSDMGAADSPPTTASAPAMLSHAGVAAAVAAVAVKNASKNMSACLENLGFAKFKEKMRAKVAVAVAKHSAGASEDGGSNPQDKIFKTMMDMIKSLEIGSSILEHYVSRLHACYGGILEEERAEQARALTQAAASEARMVAALSGMQVELDVHTPAGATLRAEVAAMRVEVAAEADHLRRHVLLATLAAGAAVAVAGLAACWVVAGQRRRVAALETTLAAHGLLAVPSGSEAGRRGGGGGRGGGSSSGAALPTQLQEAGSSGDRAEPPAPSPLPAVGLDSEPPGLHGSPGKSIRAKARRKNSMKKSESNGNVASSSCGGSGNEVVHATVGAALAAGLVHAPGAL